MDEPATPSASRSVEGRPRRVLAVVIVALVVAAGFIGVGVYGLVHGPGSGDAAPGGPNSTRSPAPTVTAPAAPGASPVPVASSGGPEQFARRVAVAVFTWDTATGYAPSDYIQQLVNVGDPSGNETQGLAADLAAYLPDAAAWAQLRQYETRQWLTIDTATVPTTWKQALQQGNATLLPGTTAYTITGTRHRAGVWDGKPVTTAEQVSFTIFETCQPTYPTCRVLRLSQLDNPLP
ncbi:MAG TPA: hypothetical protein VGC67_17175 [Cellulomonas sp.]